MKIYKRRCIIAREQFPVNELIRFVMTQNKEIKIDFLNTKTKIPGRGAYVENKEEKIRQVLEKKLLNRAFKTNIINKEVYQKLSAQMELEWQKKKKENQI